MCLISQGDGRVRGGSGRTGGNTERIVGEYRSEDAQAVVGYEGAPVGVAVVVTLDSVGFSCGGLLNARYRSGTPIDCCIPPIIRSFIDCCIVGFHTELPSACFGAG